MRTSDDLEKLGQRLMMQPDKFENLKLANQWLQYPEKTGREHTAKDFSRTPSLVIVKANGESTLYKNPSEDIMDETLKGVTRNKDIQDYIIERFNQFCFHDLLRTEVKTHLLEKGFVAETGGTGTEVELTLRELADGSVEVSETVYLRPEGYFNIEDDEPIKCESDYFARFKLITKITENKRDNEISHDIQYLEAIAFDPVTFELWPELKDFQVLHNTHNALTFSMRHDTMKCADESRLDTPEEHGRPTSNPIKSR